MRKDVTECVAFGCRKRRKKVKVPNYARATVRAAMRKNYENFIEDFIYEMRNFIYEIRNFIYEMRNFIYDIENFIYEIENFIFGIENFIYEIENFIY